MKKLFFTVLLAVTSLLVKAQTGAGSFVVGGGFDYSSTKPENSNNTKTTNVSLEPSVGYFVIDNLSVGLNFGISSTKNTSAAGTSKTSDFYVGPFVRYYIFTSNENFAFYGQADFNISAGKTTAINGNETKSSQFDIGVRPGFSYFFNKHWATELGFQGIRYTSYDPNTSTNDDKQNTFEFGFNSLTPSSLGIRYYFK